MQLRRGTELLGPVSVQPQQDAALLLCRVLGKDRAWQLAHPDVPLTPTQLNGYEHILSRRLRHEPIQYILGEQEFFGLPFKVTPAVLIPRPETEHVVEAVLARVPRDRPVRIADVGTGSGAIALALAAHLPHARMDALDISPEALAVADENARAPGLAERVRFLESDLLAAVAGEQYECIVSNPPYVASGEDLEPQVALWEPRRALFAGPDGMDAYRALLPQAAEQLSPGGFIALELGQGQQEALSALFAHNGRWTEPAYLPDLRGIARVALAALH